MWHYIDHEKDAVDSRRAETRRLGMALFDLSWEHGRRALPVFAVLRKRTSNRESP